MCELNLTSFPSLQQKQSLSSLLAQSSVGFLFLLLLYYNLAAQRGVCGPAHLLSWEHERHEDSQMLSQTYGICILTRFQTV